MATNTPNYNMLVPDEIDFFDIEQHLSDNLRIIDTGLVPYVGTTSGTTNVYTITSSIITELHEGIAISLKFNLDSTGASSLNVNNLGAKTIKKANGTDATNLKASGIYTLRYDGTSFILQGEGASGNATASDLLSGKTATTDVGEIVGTLDLTNLTSNNIKSGVTINGVTGNSNVVDTSLGDATANNILSGKKAYVDGSLVTGNIPSKAAATITPGTSDQTIATGQYLSGAQTVKGDPNLVPSNILSGKSIFGVAGSVVPGKKSASGSTQSGSTSVSFTSVSGAVVSSDLFALSVTGLTFKPSIIAAKWWDANNLNEYVSVYMETSFYGKVVYVFSGTSYGQYMDRAVYFIDGDISAVSVVSGSFTIPVKVTQTYNWIAIE